MTHRIRPRALPGLLAALVLLALASATITSAAPATRNPAAGKAIYDVKCVACHKPDGTGGPQLSGVAIPNWKSPSTWADPKRRDMDAYLRECIANGNLSKGMLPWVKSGQLKPAEVEHVIAHIHALANKK
jgi:mono/diheme cytochrome c family protein